MAVFNGIQYTINVGREGPGASPVEQIGADDSRATIVFDYAWVDRSRFATRWLGYPQVQGVNGSGRAYISRNVPHAFTDWQTIVGSLPFLYATRITRTVGLAPPGAPNRASAYFGQAG